MAGRGAVSAFADHCTWTGASSNDRQNWLISRRAGIGGSDVAAILGVDPWRSALEVYADKIAEGEPTDEQNEIADWGRIFEPLILKEFARRTKRRVVPGGKLMRSKRAEHHLITLDGVQLTRAPAGCRGPGVAEVKTTGYASEYSADPNDAELAYEDRVRVPVRVQVQFQWELSVTGAEWGSTIWLPFPERRLQWQDMRRHEAFQERLIEAVDEMWTRIRTRTPPDPDGSESATRALFKLFPGQTDEVIKIRKACGISDEYERNRRYITALTDRNRLIRNVLAATMGEARHAVLEDGRYWGAAYYAEKDTTCPHCAGVLGHKNAYRTFTLRAPRKKPHTITGGVRDLALDLDARDAALDQQLAASLVGQLAPSNDPGGEQGAAE